MTYVVHFKTLLHHPFTHFDRQHVYRPMTRQQSTSARPKSPVKGNHPLGTRRCCDVESTSMTLIQRRNNVVCPVGKCVGCRVSF